jgi:hypothetical protein
MSARRGVRPAVGRPDPSSSIDFDLHGLASVRVVDGSPADAAAVERQLGPIRAELTGEPDIVVRFVDRLELTEPVRLLGVDDSGFTEEGFLVLRSRHKSKARVLLPLSEVGARPEIVCERGLAAVPHLIAILNLTVLANGALPLHAAAFSYDGIGVVSTGWSKGGKTESLLAFAAHGAQYVADEWAYISADGTRVHGIPEPVRLWDWHLRQAPEYRARIGWRRRARLGALRAAAATEQGARAVRRGRRGGIFDRAYALLRSQLYVDAEPERLFGASLPSTSFDRLFFLLTHDSPETTVEPIDPEEVARRMLFSLQHERKDLLTAYWKLRFAFPEAASPLIDDAALIEQDRLLEVFRGKPAYVVRHPYPTSLERLYAEMREYC